MTERTIPASAEGLPKEIQIDVENQIDMSIHYLHVLPTLASDIFEQLERDTDKDADGRVVYRLTGAQVNQFDFILSDLVKRSSQLHDDFEAFAFTGAA